MIFPDLIGFGAHLGESTNLSVALTPMPLAEGRSGDLLGALQPATRGSVTQLAQPAVTRDGIALRTSFDDWYHRIHLVPGSIALGNIAGVQERDAVLWNAFFVSVSLSDFQVINGAGITYTTNRAAPYTLPALGTIDYTFEIGTFGPPIIDATAQWTIDGVLFSVPITGNRSTVFPFRPNWQQPVRDTLEYKTTVQTTYSGKEQRMSLRREPRKILEYTMRLHGDDARLFDSLDFGWTGRMFSVPMWHERAVLLEEAPAGTSILRLVTAMRTFKPGGLVFLTSSAAQGAPVEVDEVFADRITLKSPLTSTWGVNSRAYPMVVAAPADSISTSRKVDTHIDVAARFVVDPVDGLLRLPLVPAPLTYLGEEIYYAEHNWRTPLAMSTAARRDEIDNSIGPMRLRRQADFPLLTRSMKWFLKTREEAELLLQFVVRRHGRQKPVWMPSGFSDFKAVAAAVAGQSSLYITRSQHDALLADHRVRQHVVIYVRGGEKLVRQIVSVENAPDNQSLLTLSAPFAVGIPLDQIKRISYLGLYRLTADTFTFNWVTDEVSEADATFTLTDPTP